MKKICQLEVMKLMPKIMKQDNEVAVKVASGTGLLMTTNLKRKSKQLASIERLKLITIENMKAPLSICRITSNFEI